MPLSLGLSIRRPVGHGHLDFLRRTFSDATVTSRVSRRPLPFGSPHGERQIRRLFTIPLLNQDHPHGLRSNYHVR
jgi:hypothetical protein